MTSPYRHTQVQGLDGGISARLLEPGTLYVRGSATANIADLTAASNSQDGITFAAGEIILLTEQTDPIENGPYVYGSLGGGSTAALTRHAFWPEDGEPIPGTEFYVSEGTTRANRRFQYTGNAGAVIGTDTLTFEEISTEATNVQNVAQVNIPLTSFVDADGDPLAKFVSEAAPSFGFNLADSEALNLRWNNDATPGTALCQISLPQDLDDARDISLHFLCSKSGATVGDATTLTITAFFQTVGALHDADADAGGVTNALAGNAAAKTVAELIRTIAAADVPAAPASMTFTVKPTAGLLGTDDLLMHACWLEYVRKVA